MQYAGPPRAMSHLGSLPFFVELLQRLLEAANPLLGDVVEVTRELVEGTARSHDARPIHETSVGCHAVGSATPPRPKHSTGAGGSFFNGQAGSPAGRNGGWGVTAAIWIFFDTRE